MSPDQPNTGQTLPPPTCRRQWPWWLVLVLAALVGGAALGAHLEIWADSQRDKEFRQHPERAPERFAQRVKKELDLTDDQTAKVQEVLTRQWEATQRIRQETYSLYKPLLDKTDRDISKVLTAEQKPKWDEYFRVIRSRYQGNSATATQPAAGSSPAQN